MTLAPHVAQLRNGTKMGDIKYLDSMIHDGLWDAFNQYHMGRTVENVASQYCISRDAQDEFALTSQNKAEAAQKSRQFIKAISPFTVKSHKGDIIIDKVSSVEVEALSLLRIKTRWVGVALTRIA